MLVEMIWSIATDVSLWIQVGTSHRIKGADHALESIHNIKEAFPELWEEGDKTEDVHHPSKIALETSVIA